MWLLWLYYRTSPGRMTSLVCFFLFILLITVEYRPISHYRYKLGMGTAYNIKLKQLAGPYTFTNKLFFFCKPSQNTVYFTTTNEFFFSILKTFLHFAMISSKLSPVARYKNDNFEKNYQMKLHIPNVLRSYLIFVFQS